MIITNRNQPPKEYKTSASDTEPSPGPNGDDRKKSLDEIFREAQQNGTLYE